MAQAINDSGKNVTSSDSVPRRGAYSRCIMLLLRTILSSLPLVALPALAADAEIETGITRIGPSMFIFTIAIALLLTLVFRAAAAHLANYISARRGQARVRRILRSRSKHTLHDVILQGAYGGLAKIDHAILTTAGIVCIRTVHCSGRIAGNEDDAQWNLSAGMRRKRFLNPLIQNEGRSRAIRKAVGEFPVSNLVVFTGKVDFDGEPSRNVIRVDELRSYLKRLVVGPARADNWEEAWSRLSDAVLDDEDARRDFDAQISFS